jgi:hypothetical protein
MPDVDDAIEWDFLTVVDWWNLYGLPVLLVIVTFAVLLRSRNRPAATASRDGSKTVLLIGLIHCVLALQALISLVQELLTIRTMGIPQSFVTPVGALFSSLVNPILAIGLLRHILWARRFAIAWYAFLLLIAIMVVVWLCYYHVGITITSWPEQLISKILPAVLLVVMLLPRIKRVFASQARKESLTDQSGPQGELTPVAGAPSAWTVVSLLSLLCFIVACSNLVVNTADWANRLLFDSESLP